MKKKLFLLLTFLCTLAVGVSFLFTENSFLAYAEEDTCTLTYVTESGIVAHVAEVEIGSVITEFVSYSDLSIYNDDELYGKKPTFYYDGTEDAVVLPLTANGDIRIKIVLVEVPQTVTYTYRYAGTEKVFTYAVGEHVVSPSKFDSYAATGSYYRDEYFTQPVSFPQYAEKDELLYPVLNKSVSFTFNGEDYICPYGTAVGPATQKGTHRAKNAFVDKEMTTPYALPITVPVTLYGETERTHYALGFNYRGTVIDVFLPIDNPTVSKDMVPAEYADAVWYYSGTHKVVFPFTVTEDMTVYASSEDAPVSVKDYIVLFVAGGAIIAAVIAFGVFEIIKRTKRKKKGN